MISKILFLAALVMIVVWIVIFSFFSNSSVVHSIAVIAVFVFIVSYFSRNRTR